jgi:hypothetical protein
MVFGDEDPDQFPREGPYIEPLDGPTVTCEPCDWVGRYGIVATHRIVVDEEEGTFYAVCVPCGRNLEARINARRAAA